jgi:hypothetical protein
MIYVSSLEGSNRDIVNEYFQWKKENDHVNTCD